MCHQPLCDIVELTLNLNTAVPEPFREHTCADPYFLLERMFVAKFCPHACLTSNHIDVSDVRVEGINVPPVDIVSVGNAVSIAEANVEVSDVIVGKDNFVGPIFEAI